MSNSKGIYSYRQIAIGSILGGPIAFAYFMESNFKSFDMPKERTQSILVSLIALAILLTIGFTVTSMRLHLGLPTILLMIWFFHKKQPFDDIHKTEHEGYHKKGIGSTLIGMFSGIILTLLIAAGIVFFGDAAGWDM